MASSNSGTAGSDNGAGDVKDPNAANDTVGETTDSTKSGTVGIDSKSNYALLLAVVAVAIALFKK